MSISKEAKVGICAFVLIIGTFLALVGIRAFIFISVIICLGFLAIYLFSKKSLVAKTGGVLAYDLIILKLLMPSKYRKRIKELEKEESKTSTSHKKL